MIFCFSFHLPGDCSFPLNASRYSDANEKSSVDSRFHSYVYYAFSLPSPRLFLLLSVFLALSLSLSFGDSWLSWLSCSASTGKSGTHRTLVCTHWQACWGNCELQKCTATVQVAVVYKGLYNHRQSWYGTRPLLPCATPINILTTFLLWDTHSLACSVCALQTQFD